MRANAIGCAMAALLSMTGSLPASAESLDGRWQSEGYGLYFDVSGSRLDAYEMTAISCLRSFTAEHTSDAPSGDVVFKVVGQSATYAVRPGGSTDRRLVHRDGAASDIVIL